MPKVPLFLFGASVSSALTCGVALVRHRARCSAGTSPAPAPLPSLKPGSSPFRENEMQKSANAEEAVLLCQPTA